MIAPPTHPTAGTPLCDVRIQHKPRVRHELSQQDADDLADMVLGTSRTGSGYFDRTMEDGNDGSARGYEHRMREQARHARLMGLRALPDTLESTTATGHDGEGTHYDFVLEPDGSWRLERMWRGRRG